MTYAANPIMCVSMARTFHQMEAAAAAKSQVINEEKKSAAASAEIDLRTYGTLPLSLIKQIQSLRLPELEEKHAQLSVVKEFKSKRFSYDKVRDAAVEIAKAEEKEFNWENINTGFSSHVTHVKESIQSIYDNYVLVLKQKADLINFSKNLLNALGCAADDYRKKLNDAILGACVGKKNFLYTPEAVAKAFAPFIEGQKVFSDFQKILFDMQEQGFVCINHFSIPKGTMSKFNLAEALLVKVVSKIDNFNLGIDVKTLLRQCVRERLLPLIANEEIKETGEKFFISTSIRALSQNVMESPKYHSRGISPSSSTHPLHEKLKLETETWLSRALRWKEYFTKARNNLAANYKEDSAVIMNIINEPLNDAAAIEQQILDFERADRSNIPRLDELHHALSTRVPIRSNFMVYEQDLSLKLRNLKDKYGASIDVSEKLTLLRERFVKNCEQYAVVNRKFLYFKTVGLYKEITDRKEALEQERIEKQNKTELMRNFFVFLRDHVLGDEHAKTFWSPRTRTFGLCCFGGKTMIQDGALRRPISVPTSIMLLRERLKDVLLDRVDLESLIGVFGGDSINTINTITNRRLKYSKGRHDVTATFLQALNAFASTDLTNIDSTALSRYISIFKSNIRNIYQEEPIPRTGLSHRAS